MDVLNDNIREYPEHDFWTYGYFPFAMGGSVWQPIVAKVPCEGPFDLGKGYQGYMTVNPLTGKQHVCEAKSCALVGNNLEEVKKDIEEGDEKMMANQVKHAMMEYNNAKRVEPDELWKRLRNAEK